MIEHPATGYSPEAWKVLELLYEYDAPGARPDGEYQGGMLRSELKAATRIGDESYTLLIYKGQIVERAANFQTDDPDQAWGVEITPRGRQTVDFGHMHTFLSSIATALPQGDQAGWMVATAKDGLRQSDDGEST